MGYSIGKVFKPIEMEMRRYAEVESLYLPVPNYSPKGLWKNIKAAKAAIIEKEYDLVHITGTENYLIPFINGTKPNKNLDRTIEALKDFPCKLRIVGPVPDRHYHMTRF